ncbi:hypothetical protein LIER_32616 [Lithospermum erythrorhizon]|uniref:Uncharacterized protein n=1 Tax=Lithospermum erythrorhizon TaxID=34254 RepID=A0AAV3RUB3_LITER
MIDRSRSDIGLGNEMSFFWILVVHGWVWSFVGFELQVLLLQVPQIFSNDLNMGISKRVLILDALKLGLKELYIIRLGGTSVIGVFGHRFRLNKRRSQLIPSVRNFREILTRLT